MIYSPDTDVHFIPLALTQITNSSKKIIMQLSMKNAKKQENEILNQKEYMSLTKFIESIHNDNELSCIPAQERPKFVCMIFILSGCDYVSYFANHGKVSFLKYCFKYAQFIYSGKLENGMTIPGRLLSYPNPVNCTECETSLCGSCIGKIGLSFLAFVRIIGCLYFFTSRSAFKEDSPEALFRSMIRCNSEVSADNIHKLWLQEIRSKSYERCEYETECVPSDEALYFHWLRTVYISIMWGQACESSVNLRNLENFGWKLDSGKLEIVWDTEENMTRINERVEKLKKGCGCTTGCDTRKCSCFKINKLCEPGCTCINCKNIPFSTDSSIPAILTNTEADRDTTFIELIEEEISEQQDVIITSAIEYDDQIDL